MNLIPDLILAWALMQPLDGKHEHCWWGCRIITVWNMHGYGVKTSIWQGGETHVGFGRAGKIVLQTRIW